MRFLVDIGNSRIKWASLSGTDTLENHGVLSHRSRSWHSSLKGNWQAMKQPKQVFIANVAGDMVAESIITVVREIWGLVPVFVTVEKNWGGLIHAYEDNYQLGIDRWLAMIAAWDRYHDSVCIVNCGTALTIDYISASGRHAGGLIIPGLVLMQKILSDETSDIDVQLSTNLSLDFGQSTSECVANGALYTVVSLIDRVISDLKSEYGNQFHCIITGGYGEEVNEFLLHKCDYEPHLVLRGLVVKSGAYK